MKISFAPEAAKDLDEAVEWYEAEGKGLGKRFAKTIDPTSGDRNRDFQHEDTKNSR